jgi:hypothetical protein
MGRDNPDPRLLVFEWIGRDQFFAHPRIAIRQIA